LQNDTDNIKLLSSLEEKRRLIEKIGIDNMIVIPFEKELSNLTSEQFFYDYLLKKIKITYLLVGYDHRFGKGGQADSLKIKQLCSTANIGFEILKACNINGITVSSTKIRNILQCGDVASAKTYLNYPYFLSGTVINGKKIGKKIGFPTANIQVDEELKLLPSDGIYAVKILADNDNNLYNGMLNIGLRPTISNDNLRTIEVNIFDFDRYIYQESIKIYFIARLRNEIKFDNINALQQQLAQDKINALELLKYQEKTDIEL
jgi:riboflavin kinase/FMN adenylyltransferase